MVHWEQKRKYPLFYFSTYPVSHFPQSPPLFPTPLFPLLDFSHSLFRCPTSPHQKHSKFLLPLPAPPPEIADSLFSFTTLLFPRSACLNASAFFSLLLAFRSTFSPSDSSLSWLLPFSCELVDIDVSDPSPVPRWRF